MELNECQAPPVTDEKEEIVSELGNQEGKLLCNRPQRGRTHIILLAIKSTSPPYTRTKRKNFTTKQRKKYVFTRARNKHFLKVNVENFEFLLNEGKREEGRALGFKIDGYSRGW